MRPLRCAEGGHLSVNRILNENAGQTCRLQTYRLQSGRVIRNCGSNSGLFKVRSRIQSARSVTAGFATCGDGGVIFASHPNMFQLTIGTYATKLSSRQDIDRLLRRAKYAGCCFPPNARVGSADGCTEWCRVASYWTRFAIASYFALRPLRSVLSYDLRKKPCSENSPYRAHVFRVLNGNFV